MPNPTVRISIFLKKYLSSRKATVIILILAFLAKAVLLKIFLNLSYDKEALILTAKNLIHGHGISIGRALANDVSTKIYEWYIGWPPGYCLLIAPLLLLLENHYMVACYIVDCFAAILFLWHLR